MLTLTRNRTARLTLIAIAIALAAAIIAPIAAFAQSAVTTPRPRITEVTLAGKSIDKKNFAVGETITALVKFDNRWEVRAVDTPGCERRRPRVAEAGAVHRRDHAGRGVRRRPAQQPQRPPVRLHDSGGRPHVKFRSVEAREMKTHNLHYVYVGNDADGCEGGELTPTGLLLSTLLVGSFLHLLPPEEIYTPYTCDEYASWLIIPRPQDPLRYEGGSGG